MVFIVLVPVVCWLLRICRLSFAVDCVVFVWNVFVLCVVRCLWFVVGCGSVFAVYCWLAAVRCVLFVVCRLLCILCVVCCVLCVDCCL